MTAGSSGVAVLICVVILIINLYCLCCSGKMKMLGRMSEGFVVPPGQTPTAPTMMMAQPQMTMAQPQMMNVLPPPPYPTQSQRPDQSVSVTVTQDQIAQIIGFTPRRPLKAIDMA